MNVWQVWLFLTINVLCWLAVYFKDAINSFFLGKYQRIEKRRDRTREILVKLHKYQSEHFASTAGFLSMSFLARTTGDAIALRGRNEFHRQTQELKADDIFLSELPRDIRVQLGDLNSKDYIDIGLKITKANNEQEFLKLLDALTTSQKKALDLIQVEIDKL